MLNVGYKSCGESNDHKNNYRIFTGRYIELQNKLYYNFTY